MGFMYCSHRQSNSDVDGDHDDGIKDSEHLSQPDLVVCLGKYASPDEDANDDNVEDQCFVICKSKTKGKSSNQHEDDTAWTCYSRWSHGVKIKDLPISVPIIIMVW